MVKLYLSERNQQECPRAQYPSPGYPEHHSLVTNVSRISVCKWLTACYLIYEFGSTPRQDSTSNAWRKARATSTDISIYAFCYIVRDSHWTLFQAVNPGQKPVEIRSRWHAEQRERKGVEITATSLPLQFWGGNIKSPTNRPSWHRRARVWKRRPAAGWNHWKALRAHNGSTLQGPHCRAN